MSRFNERLAQMADQVRALDGGNKLAIEIMRLAEDIDGYIARQLTDRRGRMGDTFVKWNEFLNLSVQGAYDEGRQLLAIERRKLARLVASDPRWQGGYADALKLLDKEASE